MQDDHAAVHDAARAESANALDCVILPATETPEFVLIFLHGYGMHAQDLVSHCKLLGEHAYIYLPEAPIFDSPAQRSWWPVDVKRREQQLHNGPRELVDEHPIGREAIRKLLSDIIAQARKQAPGIPIFFGGFSQGGMLACDTVLCEALQIDGLALVSSCRIAFDEWVPHQNRVHGLPVFVSHGRHDKNIGIASGEALKDWLAVSGADVTWAPFDGGHGMPLHVWRGLREFIHTILAKPLSVPSA